MRYLRFETDLFFTDIPDDQLGHWFLGADCAGWFYARLLPTPGIRQKLGPTMEDWGWIMAVATDGIVVDICVWEHLGHSNQWILGIAGKKGFLKRTDSHRIYSAEQKVEAALSAIVEGDTRFAQVEWFAENPMESPDPELLCTGCGGSLQRDPGGWSVAATDRSHSGPIYICTECRRKFIRYSRIGLTPTE